LRNGKPVLYFDQPISKAGHYQLLPDRARESIQSVAFNFNRQESDVRAWPKDKMETFINRTGVKVSDQDATVLQNNIASQLNGIAFWRYCVWLTLLFVLIEILLLRFLQ
jgi:hypothetical protein